MDPSPLIPQASVRSCDRHPLKEISMKKWFYAMLFTVVASFTFVAISGYFLIMVMPIRKKQWQEAGVQLSPAQQSLLDLADFWADWAWVFALIFMWPSLLASIVLGIILFKRRVSGWLGRKPAGN
jgi:type II secretory pathway component PulF